MTTQNIKMRLPQIDLAKELLEVSQDFTHPLELVREAISNSFDACASHINIRAFIQEHGSKDILIVRIEDDGEGTLHA